MKMLDFFKGKRESGKVNLLMKDTVTLDKLHNLFKPRLWEVIGDKEFRDELQRMCLGIINNNYNNLIIPKGYEEYLASQIDTIMDAKTIHDSYRILFQIYIYNYYLHNEDKAANLDLYYIVSILDHRLGTLSYDWNNEAPNFVFAEFTVLQMVESIRTVLTLSYDKLGKQECLNSLYEVFDEYPAYDTMINGIRSDKLEELRINLRRLGNDMFELRMKMKAEQV